MSDLQALVLAILIMFVGVAGDGGSRYERACQAHSAVDRWRCSMTLVLVLDLFLMGSTAATVVPTITK